MKTLGLLLAALFCLAHPAAAHDLQYAVSGANAVVVKPVPPDSVVVGVPGEVVRRSAAAHPAPGADLEHGELPDVLGQTLVSVMDRVDALEKRLAGRLAPEPHPHQPTAGAWNWEDFVI